MKVFPVSRESVMKEYCVAMNRRVCVLFIVTFTMMMTGCTWVHVDEGFHPTPLSRLVLLGPEGLSAHGRPSVHSDDTLRVEGMVRLDRKGVPYHVYGREPRGMGPNAFVIFPVSIDMPRKYQKLANRKYTWDDVRVDLESKGEEQPVVTPCWRPEDISKEVTRVSWMLTTAPVSGESGYGIQICSGFADVDRLTGHFEIEFADHEIRKAVNNGAAELFLNIKGDPVQWGNGLAPRCDWTEVRLLQGQFIKAYRKQ